MNDPPLSFFGTSFNILSHIESFVTSSGIFLETLFQFLYALHLSLMFNLIWFFVWLKNFFLCSDLFFIPSKYISTFYNLYSERTYNRKKGILNEVTAKKSYLAYSFTWLYSIKYISSSIFLIPQKFRWEQERLKKIGLGEGPNT